MATEVKLDRLTILEAQERNGDVRRLVRIAEVSGITGVDDWEVLTQALDDAGVPQYRSRLTNDVTNSGYSLILIERNPTMIDKDRVRVELVYENYTDVEDSLDDPRANYITGQMRCNIQQKTTNLDQNGNPVEVQHTYPSDDENFPGETIVQGAEFQWYQPQKTYYIRTTKETTSPWLIADEIIGHVNNSEWLGEGARQWLCTSVSWRQIAKVPTERYFMDFEFQHDPDTWDPTVVFIDSVTNKPPPDLVDGVGYKTIEKITGISFNTILGSYFAG